MLRVVYLGLGVWGSGFRALGFACLAVSDFQKEG